MKDPLDNIVDKILTLAAECHLTTPYHSDTLLFQENLKLILLNELTSLQTNDSSQS